MALRNVTKHTRTSHGEVKRVTQQLGSRITFSSRLREKGKHQSVGRSILGSVPFFFFMPLSNVICLKPFYVFCLHSFAPNIRRWNLVKSLQDGIWMLLLYWFLLVNVMGGLLWWQQAPARAEVPHNDGYRS